MSTREGSHVILQTDVPRRHRGTVPDHKAVKIGTLNAIVRSVALSQGLPKQEVARRLLG